jgi:chromosome segregation ATPase
MEGDMKNSIFAIVLAVVCIGLAVALFSIKKQAGDQRLKDGETIQDLSTNVVKTEGLLNEQKQVNISLEQTNAASKAEIVALTNKLVEASSALASVSTALDQTKAALDQTKATLKTTEEEVTKRNARIAELESQNAALDQRALDLSSAITNLTSQIDDTKRKLATSEGDKAFLEKELQRLMAEKAEMERQFNDLKVVRAQVAKLREELDISRRLEWIRKGLFAASDQKGAQQLIQQGPSAPGAAPKPQRYDLNVEVNADGSLRVIEPLTNSPAATNPPPAR